MNPLRELGDRIVADVNALLGQRRGQPLEPLPGDEGLVGGETIAVARARREDHATPLLEPVANPAVPSGLPVHGHFRGFFGEERDLGGGKIHVHAGLDIAVKAGTAVLATADGKVVHASAAGTYGNLVEIDHGNGHRTRYAHLQSIGVRLGDRISRGATIGASGGVKGARGSGRSKGPHVHYEVLVNNKAQDPERFLEGTP